MQPNQAPQVRPGTLYGITHDVDGTPRIREPKVLRVGIGLPKGPAVNVWMANDAAKPWRVRVGYNTDPEKGAIAKISGFATRDGAEKFYREQIKTAPECKHPRKTPYFCFTRQVITDQSKELFEPDFQAIEAHGPTPTEIDIVFLKDEPFDGNYAIWSASELKCKGDGKVAMRNVSFAKLAWEAPLAKAAKDAGEKYFIIDQCWTTGCPYAEKECKPHSSTRFQVAKNIRVGGTAYISTTGKVSTSRMFSSLESVKILTGGRLAGIPMKMCVRPFRANHDGKPATQYAISFEFRAQDVESLQKNLIEQAMNFRNLALGVAPVRQIEGGLGEIGFDEEDGELMDAEFSDGEQVQEQKPAAAVATEVKTAELAGKLRARPSHTRKAIVEDQFKNVPEKPATDSVTVAPTTSFEQPTSFFVPPNPVPNPTLAEKMRQSTIPQEPSLAEKLKQSRAKVTGGDSEIQEDLF